MAQRALPRSGNAAGQGAFCERRGSLPSLSAPFRCHSLEWTTAQRHGVVAASAGTRLGRAGRGGGSVVVDPKFLDLIPDQATWDDYCGAFAEEAA